LNIFDDFTRECLQIKVNRKVNSTDMIDQMFKLFVSRGIPDYIRPDNGGKFTAKDVRRWLNRPGG
jgi:putative transposase